MCCLSKEGGCVEGDVRRMSWFGRCNGGSNRDAVAGPLIRISWTEFYKYAERRKWCVSFDTPFPFGWSADMVFVG